MTTVSVIVPVYNDAAGIQDTLDALTQQEYGEYEVMVVDNASTDDTPTVIQEYESRHDVVVSAVESDIQSAYAARNTGVRNATGELYAFMDADMTAPTDYLTKLTSYFQLYDPDYVGYHVNIKRSRRGYWSWYDGNLALPVEFYMREKRFAPTCAMAATADVFEDVGLFDARMISGGDKEFGHRVHNAGYDCAYTDRIQVTHPARGRFLQQLKKSQRIGVGLAQLRERGVGDDTQSRLPIPDEVMPPDPRNVWTKTRAASRLSFPFLYVGDAVISYLQLVGALRYMGTRGAMRELSHSIRPPAEEEGY